MDWIAWLVAALFVLYGAACVLLVAINFPGTWLMLAGALLIELLDGLYLAAQPAVTFGWGVLGIALGLAVVGEIIEFFAGAAGAKAGGGTRRGMIGAIAGGVIGAILFTFLVPLPILGTLIGAVAGTFGGAVIGEVSGERPMTVGGSMRPAVGATAGRILGAVGKVAVAVVMWLLLAVAAFL